MVTRHLQTIAFPVLSLIGFLICDPLAARAQEAKSAGSETQQAITASAQQFVAAFNKGDAKAIAALWTQDGEYIDELGKRITGRAAIEKQYADFFAKNKGAAIEITIKAVQQVSPDTAIEDGLSQLTLASPASATSGQYLAIHVKQNGKWLIASVRDSALLPSSLAAPTLQDLGWLVGDWTVVGDGVEVELNYDWMENNNFIRGKSTISDGKNSTSSGTQIIGRDPVTGQLVSWFFNSDGSTGSGTWAKTGAHWVVRTQGVTAEGIPTSAINIVYDADDNVHSWQSVNRIVGDQPLPRTKEIVIQRKSDSKTRKETKE